MRKNVMLWAVVLFAPLAAYGQNLHPEVQVTNTYEGTEAALPKPGLPMALPDSLTRFDYHFDYSVFDTPYKGAYEFSPYRIQMTPEGRRDDRGTLLVRAGAGYAFRPLLDVVWAPVKAGKWSLNVFGHVAGYAGMYAGKPWQPGERSFSAYDFGSRLGLDARLALKPVEIKLEGGYEGVFASDPEASGQDAARLEPFYCFPAYHSPYVRGRVKSSSELGRRVLLDLGAEYRGIWQGASRDHILRFDGTVAPRITDNIRARVDFNLCWSSLFYVGGSIAPKADFRWGPLNLTAGLRLGYAERFTVYPDVQASVRLWQDRLFLFAAVTGQDMLFTYADLKAADHRYWASSYGVPRPAAEWINASGGVRGNTGFG
ncbi:MAG: hypothetical protein J5871_04490, partial [Bacteroidales bacterium]|nr:hypothetical protein [Bacteroidales bacterium]